MASRIAMVCHFTSSSRDFLLAFSEVRFQLGGDDFVGECVGVHLVVDVATCSFELVDGVAHFVVELAEIRDGFACGRMDVAERFEVVFHHLVRSVEPSAQRLPEVVIFLCCVAIEALCSCLGVAFEEFLEHCHQSELVRQREVDKVGPLRGEARPIEEFSEERSGFWDFDGAVGECGRHLDANRES